MNETTGVIKLIYMLTEKIRNFVLCIWTLYDTTYRRNHIAESVSEDITNGVIQCAVFRVVCN